MFDLKKIGPATFLLPQNEKMRVPGLVFGTEKLLSDLEIQRPLEQIQNVASLPGIVKYSIAMPDIHWGYGFPIGGVAAMDLQTGVISPGGVGYDINCGVRLAIVPIEFDSMSESVKLKLLKAVFKSVPSGVGSEQRKMKKLTEKEYVEIAEKGAEFSLKRGWGFSQDLEHTESNGCIEGADISCVSFKAKERGAKQIGSIGSGNHFIEIGKVETIVDEKIAKSWGIEKNATYILIHSGSRGFGHQICQDTLDLFIKKGYAKNLIDKQLVAAPIFSHDGRNYLKAMSAAANFAFNNRQMMLHLVREAFHEVLGIDEEKIVQIYDVCHNIAKIETHEVDGVLKKLCIHRKGATRAFGPDAKELPELFKKTGQPVIVPGDMGRASYLMVGLGNPLSFCSSCHGAGRITSRTKSSKEWSGVDLIKKLEEMGVKVLAASRETIAEEMPFAYKDVHEVVEAVEKASLARKVVLLQPKLVVKG